jgi:aminopeptidase-like protein
MDPSCLGNAGGQSYQKTRFEERIVFPLAERVLKAKTLSDLGAAWLKKREPALK